MEPTFKKRSGTTNKGFLYEDLNIASFVLKLIKDKDVKDFYISASDENFGAFDDIVVELELQSRKEGYALQLKHSDNKILTLKRLTSKKGDFSISKYFDSYQTIKSSESKFVLFTNLKLDVSHRHQIQLEGEDFCIELLKFDSNTFTIFEKTKCYYSFRVVPDTNWRTPENNLKFKKYKTFLQNFFLFVGQDNVTDLKADGVVRFKEMFSADDVEFDRYLNFIAEWSLQEGSKYKLNKTWMQRAISLQLLSSKIQLLNFDSTLEKAKILQEAVLRFDVTIFEQKSYDKVKVIWSDVQNDFKDVKEVNKIRKKYQLNPTYFSNLQNIDDITWCKLLWLADKCPLIVAHGKSVQKAIELCPKGNFIVVGENLTNEWNEKSVFQDLSDLKNHNNNSDVYDKLTKNFTCAVQGKKEFNLNYLIAQNPEVLKIIKTDTLVVMLDGPLNIGGKEEVLSIPYIERFLFKPVIDIRYLEKVEQGILIIVYSVSEIDRLKVKLCHLNFIDSDRFLGENSNDSTSNGSMSLSSEFTSQNIIKNVDLEESDIYVTKNEYSEEYFQQLCSVIKWTKNSHQFRYTEDENLEWLQSKGEIGNVENYILSQSFAVQEETLWNTKPINNINLIVGDPGMGKTELLKNLKNNFSFECWTVFIYPKDIDNFFEKSHYPTNAVCDFEIFLLEDKYKNLNRFERKFLKMQMEQNGVFFVWDALDEISNEHLESTTNFILQFSKRNIVQWVTSRCHLKKYLETKFNVLCMNMTQFNEEEQDFYIKNRLSDVNSAVSIEEAIKKIKNTFAVVEHCDILGIPLQLFMLTSLFRRNGKKYLLLLNNTFALTDLYQCFIEEKFNIYCEKRTDFNSKNLESKKIFDVFKKVTLESYEKLALKTLLSGEYLKRLNVNVMKDLQIVQETNVAIGLVTDVTTQIPRFLHNSFAEYLVAVYFSKNFELKNVLADIIFDQKYINVRFFFDLLLAKQSLPHIAVLYKNYSLLETCGDEIKTCKDEGGRTLLHIACSWETTYPRFNVEKDNEVYVIDEDSASYVTKRETNNHDLIKYLTMHDQHLIEDALFNMTPTLYAQKCNCLLSVLEIMKNQNKPIPKICDEVAVNILFYSAVFGYDGAINIFMSNDLPFIETKNNKSSLLHLSISHPTFVHKLLSVKKYKKAINMTNKKKRTALYLASEIGCKKTVETLILHGAEVNLPDGNCNTPLHVASLNNNDEIVAFLIASGAVVDAATKYGITPLAIASFYGHQHIVEILTRSGANVNLAYSHGFTALHIASQENNEKVVEFLLASGVSVNATNNDGPTPLSIASFHGHQQIVEILIKSGADVNLSSKTGKTPLHVAAQNGFKEIIEILIASGARVNIADKKGFTPAYYIPTSPFMITNNCSSSTRALETHNV